MAAHDESMEDGFPAELQDRVNTFDEALSSVEAILQPLHNVPLTQVHTEVGLILKIDFIFMNALYWAIINGVCIGPTQLVKIIVLKCDFTA